MDIINVPQSPVSLSTLIENISDMVTVTDASGRITFVSQSAFIMLGYAPIELVGHRFMDFVTADDQAAASRQLHEVLEQTDEQYRSELHFLHKNGGVRLLSSHVVNRLDNADIGALVITSRDITEERERQEAYQQALADSQRSLKSIVSAIANTIVARDPYTGSHQLRVAHLSQEISKALGFDRNRQDNLYLAASIHDIGKVRIPIEILTKPLALIDEELALIKIHPQVGYEILKPLDLPWPFADIVHQHHERLDGSGYPQGLGGDDILLEAQIIAVADSMEAMVNDRPYRKAPGLDAALATLQRGRGRFFNAEAVDICRELFEGRGYAFPVEAWRQAKKPV